MSSNLAIKIVEKSVGHCSVYHHGGIAKRLSRNKQSTPTPLSNISTPCRGVDMRQA